MSKQQHEMFAAQEAELEAMIAGVHEGDAALRWPPMLAELVDVMRAHFARRGTAEDAALREAQAVVVALAHYFGGQQVYIPRGDTLKAALRDAEIWHAFDGRNAADLARRYDMSVITVYKIIARERALRTKRAQPDLFSREPK